MALAAPRLSNRAATLVAAAILAAVSAALIGCHANPPPQRPMGAPGHWYTVAPGETLGDIARKAGVPEEDLLEVNGLHDRREVVPGKTIFVLDRVTEPDPEAGAPPAVAASELAPAEPRQPARFRWPVDSPRLTSVFGSRWGKAHEGIDITAPIGTPVYAADEGEVVYANSFIKGYGNMVVIKHSGDLMTVYAHNSVLLVKVGQRVAAGQKLALSGQSGHATGPHVHFEIRRAQVPRDPLPYLPDIRDAPVRRPRSPKS